MKFPDRGRADKKGCVVSRKLCVNTPLCICASVWQPIKTGFAALRTCSHANSGAPGCLQAVLSQLSFTINIIVTMASVTTTANGSEKTHVALSIGRGSLSLRPLRPYRIGLKPRRRSRGPGASRPPTISWRRSAAGPSTGTFRWAATTRPSCSLRTTLYNGGRSSAWSPRSPFYASADLANVMHAVPFPPRDDSVSRPYYIFNSKTSYPAHAICNNIEGRLLAKLGKKRR